MSGAVVPELAAPATGDLGGFPLVQVHGEWDTVLPVELGRQARDYLTALHADLVYREFGMGHEVSSESLEFVQRWLETRLDR